MLVLSHAKDHNGELHVLNRLKERLDTDFPDAEKWFLSILAEINCFLPGDWRMTKSNNNFRIQVITPQSQLSLVGFSYKRENHKDIINIIDTVLYKHYIDSKENNLKTAERITKQDISNNPDLVQPNLYYFQPCPEDSFSPLYARQYERVKYKNKAKNQLVGTQYHRIHPLTRAGLDLEHYKWIRWDINGNIEFVDYPNKDYHGKSFWQIPALKSKNNRASEEEYLEQYNGYIEKHKVDKPNMTEPAPAPAERELKYCYEGSLNDFKGKVKALKEFLETEGFQAIWQGPKEQTDFYFDDDNFTLYESNVSFRLRKKSDNSRITLKKRMPLDDNAEKEGLYYRMEEEVAISKAQEEALIRGERINPFPYRLISYLAPDCGKLRKVLEIKNKRTTALITDNLLQRIELCHDIVTYKAGDKEYGPVFEIELESKGADNELMETLAEVIKSEYNLTPSKHTKYEQGLTLLK